MYVKINTIWSDIIFNGNELGGVIGQSDIVQAVIWNIVKSGRNFENRHQFRGYLGMLFIDKLSAQFGDENVK